MMKRMRQKKFTDKEINILNKNPYVKKVSEKAIIYHDEFKRLLVVQLDEGKTPRMFF